MESRDYVDSVAEDWNPVYTDLDLSGHYLALRTLRLGRLLQTRLEEVAASHGFTVPGDFDVLNTIRRSAPEAVPPSELADRLMITTAGMTGRLDRLESADLISRRPHPSDRRSIVIEITEKGIRVAKATFIEIVDAENSMFATIPPPDRARLANHLRLVLTESGDVPSPGESE